MSVLSKKQLRLKPTRAMTPSPVPVSLRHSTASRTLLEMLDSEAIQRLSWITLRGVSALLHLAPFC